MPAFTTNRTMATFSPSGWVNTCGSVAERMDKQSEIVSHESNFYVMKAI